jgi:hypothetical protein
VYQGQVVEPTVSLYDSHERIHVTGAVPSGTEVQVELYQTNPVLDFYYVREETSAGPQKGWVLALVRIPVRRRSSSAVTRIGI